MATNEAIRLKVAAAQQQDVGKGIVRVKQESVRIGFRRGD